jgi:membrane protease YdiL (CAAX protease family)
VSPNAAAGGRARKRWWSPQPPPNTTPISARRAYVEVLAVFAAFFGAGIVAAGFSLSSDLPSPTGGWGLFLPNAVDELAQAGVAAALVLLLLSRRGISPRAFGLVLPQRADGKWAAGQTLRIATWALVAFFVGSIVTSALATGKYNASPHLNAAYLVYTSTAALNAGVIEEMVVLGFVLVTLQQARRPLWEVVAVGLVLRATYHIYYGPGVLGILVWASIFIWLYLRTRSLLPIMATHFMWDLVAFFGQRWTWIVYVAFLCGLVMTVAAPITWLVERANRTQAAPWTRGVPLSSGPTAGDPATVPPGWHPDPWGQLTWRWWDGTRWTDTTA